MQTVPPLQRGRRVRLTLQALVMKISTPLNRKSDWVAHWHTLRVMKHNHQDIHNCFLFDILFSRLFQPPRYHVYICKVKCYLDCFSEVLSQVMKKIKHITFKKLSELRTLTSDEVETQHRYMIDFEMFNTYIIPLSMTKRYPWSLLTTS